MAVGDQVRSAAIRLLASLAVAVAVLLPGPVWPQAPTLLTPQQLDQMLAPVALYPDPLLGQILMASTYPLEVVEAARWLEDPANAALKGERLAVALEDQDWDPSVKSLVPFPQVLQMMSSHLAWTQRLGDAFLAQQSDVMDSVQRLRARARAAGTLYSTPEAVVSEEGPLTMIEPADPQLVYVPYYDPTIIYGVWPYPAYPPFYFPLYPGFGTVVVGRISFGFPISVVFPLWGWVDWDWHRHYLHIDDHRFNAINHYAIVQHHVPRVTSPIWHHEPFHRRGVAYRDEGSRARFLGSPTGSPETRRPYRGFERAPAASPRLVSPALPAPFVVTPPPTAPSVHVPPAPQISVPPVRVPPAPQVNVPPVRVPPAPQVHVPPVRVLPAPQVDLPPVRVAPPAVHVAPPSSGSSPTPRVIAPTIQQPGPSRPTINFGEIERGRAVHMDAQRGRASRESIAAPPRPVARPAPGPSGGSRGGHFGRRNH